jgi:hypothetical protein
MTKKEKDLVKKSLKPLNAVIQICPVCSKVDVYKGDGHDCDDYLLRRSSSDWED